MSMDLGIKADDKTFISSSARCVLFRLRCVNDGIKRIE